MPKVSVIVPVYGVEKYIERCADSLFAQTLDDIEFIFVDDCSPDRSMELLNAKIEKNRPHFVGKNWQVKTERMPANCGQAAVRRHGVRLSKGNFIIHCDSDDWVEPDYCKALYETAIKDDSDAVICDYVTTDGQTIIKKVKGCSSTDKCELINGMLFQRDPWSLCNKLFRRTACYKDDFVFPKGNMGEDMLMTFQLILNAQKISYVEKPLYNYFFNPSSITKAVQDEKILNNYIQLKMNSDLLLLVFEENGKAEQYTKGILSLKWFVKKYLWNMSSNKMIRNEWRESYPEITLKALTSPLLSYREKCKYVMTNLGLYPFKKA